MASNKCKDKKGRVLRSGESQRKDGKYEYKYEDTDGVRRSLYSWRLVSTDVLPPGKQSDLSLREKIGDLNEDLAKGNNIRKSKMTLNEWIELYLAIKKFANLTYENYLFYYRKAIRNSELGKKQVGLIKKSDIKRFYAQQSQGGYADGMIQILHKIIRPSLELAVEDEIIGKNPANSCCSQYHDAKNRQAMTKQEQSIFFNDILKYVKQRDKFELIYMLIIELSCRVNELIGLTWNDVDIKKRVVNIDHGLVYRKKDGKMRFYITSGTSKNVKRRLPMTNLAYDCFRKLHENRLKHRSKVVIDGYSDFVFVTGVGTPLNPNSMNTRLNKAVAKYKNETGNDFPEISNHIFRHSGCTNMAEAEMDVNVMMHIMGHRDLKLIMQVYDSVNFERIKRQMNKLNEVPASVLVGNSGD